VATASESASGSGTIGSGGISPSTNTRGLLLTFNLVMEFLQELWWNYQGV
jgi:hypothetical protein